MNRSRGLFWLVAASLLVVAACGVEPTGPEATALAPVATFKKPVGVGDPGGDLPLTVVFADGTDDGIRSDGNPVYEHGEEFVSAIIRTNGMFYFQTFDGKRKERELMRGGLTVAVDENSMVIHEPDHLEAFKLALEAAGDSWPVFTSDVTLHTRNTDGGMYTMEEVGSTLVDGGKIGFNDYGDGRIWEWRLLFDTRRDVDDDGVDEADNLGLCITLTDTDPKMWSVTTEGAACGPDGDDTYDVDDVTELWRLVDGDFIRVADFETPMHLTLTGN